MSEQEMVSEIQLNKVGEAVNILVNGRNPIDASAHIAAVAINATLVVGLVLTEDSKRENLSVDKAREIVKELFNNTINPMFKELMDDDVLIEKFLNATVKSIGLARSREEHAQMMAAMEADESKEH